MSGQTNARYLLPPCLALVMTFDAGGLLSGGHNGRWGRIEPSALQMPVLYSGDSLSSPLQSCCLRHFRASSPSEMRADEKLGVDWKLGNGTQCPAELHETPGFRGPH